MKFLKMLKAEWTKLSTAEKIGVGIDMICGIGAGVASRSLGDKLAENCRTRFGKFCTRVATAGAVLATAESGAKYLKKNYGDTTGMLIDISTGKAKLNSVEVNKDGITLEGEYKDE